MAFSPPSNDNNNSHYLWLLLKAADSSGAAVKIESFVSSSWLIDKRNKMCGQKIRKNRPRFESILTNQTRQNCRTSLPIYFQRTSKSKIYELLLFSSMIIKKNWIAHTSSEKPTLGIGWYWDRKKMKKKLLLRSNASKQIKLCSRRMNLIKCLLIKNISGFNRFLGVDGDFNGRRLIDTIAC